MLRSLLGRRPRRRVAVIGLDCAAPELVFERFAADLPTFSHLRARGLYGELESVIPAITVPAWMCMMSGQDPGSLGVYGFRNRADHTYKGLKVANATSFKEPLLWDILGQHDYTTLALGVPGTYPPRPIRGALVGCFLTPDTSSDYTYPASLKSEIAAWVGDYQTDVKGFRTNDKAWLLEQIRRMTHQRFEVARRLVSTREWDCFVMVEIGLDRIHHGFWSELDPAHRHHDPASPFRGAIRDYYRLLDSELAALLAHFDDETDIFIVSDHGAQSMRGGICINEWLIREGYLALRGPLPTSPTRFDELDIDWERTRAWGDGGYYGRVFINLQGREPQGAVDPAEYDALRDELSHGLSAIGDEHDQPIGTRCFTPEALYRRVGGVAPDLLVYFGDLAWRSIGGVGWDALHTFENDTGPDDANHAQRGMFLYHDPRRDLGGRRLEGLHLLQMAPTIVKRFGLAVPPAMTYPAITLITDAP